ncbi:hypothetical protein I552_6512 [Mycobacterium xenopi 3993]|nr:hypothetical protein I552_6512 [Mycobacterium xenopi 3993]
MGDFLQVNRVPSEQIRFPPSLSRSVCCRTAVDTTGPAE